MRIVVLVMLALCSCDATKKSTKATVAADPVAAATEQALLSAPWAGAIQKKVIEIVFQRSGKKKLGAEIHYRSFGRTYATDKIDVTIDPVTHAVTLNGRSSNALIGSPKAQLDQLVGTLSPDKTELSGVVPAQGTFPAGAWSVSTAKSLAELDPPLDPIAAETALLGGQWEGKCSAKPSKLVVTKKKGQGQLMAKLTRGNQASNVTVSFSDGLITLKTQPRPTPQGLVTEAGQLYFATHALTVVTGTYEIETTQGFVSQSGSEACRFENLKLAKK